MDFIGFSKQARKRAKPSLVKKKIIWSDQNRSGRDQDLNNWVKTTQMSRQKSRNDSRESWIMESERGKWDELIELRFIKIGPVEPKLWSIWTKRSEKKKKRKKKKKKEDVENQAMDRRLLR